jgi:glycosyltransferase involved in cell wall biosynthesis
MKPPLISICLPNLNTFGHLQERADTIFAQTYQNWELVISDNHSEDGAWEFFQKLARKDQRVSIAQAPREGLYPNWNNCIRRSQGRYVYIAASDDTMVPDCLEKLAGALEQHADCDLAHCPLMVIDEVGAAVDDPKWPDCTVFADGMPELIHRAHVHPMTVCCISQAGWFTSRSLNCSSGGRCSIESADLNPVGVRSET